MSLGDFSAIVAPSGAARERGARPKAELREAMHQCEEADRTTRRAIVRVGNGMTGDPDEGARLSILGSDTTALSGTELMRGANFTPPSIFSVVLARCRRAVLLAVAGYGRHRRRRVTRVSEAREGDQQ